MASTRSDEENVEVTYMPRIIVQAHRGRTIDQKRELIRRITEDVVDVFQVKSDAVSVLIQESELENVGRGGVLDLDRTAAEKAVPR
jgi:4-oxalocrotonate tautomerase